jgi:hypothetical protein
MVIVRGKEGIEKTISRTVGRGRSTEGCRSDNKFSRRANRDENMATEGCRHAVRKRKAEKLAEIDKELIDIRVDIEKRALRMQ